MSKISVVILNYNGGELVLDTIRSVLNQKQIQPRVIVVDDGSTDGSPKAIRSNFPEVEVYCEPENTKRVNSLRNRGISLSDTDLVFVTDNDLKFDPHCISELIDAMKHEDDVGACIPRLMYLEDRSRIYSMGGRVHYVGATTAPERDRAVTAKDFEPEPTIAVGGGIALFDKRKLQQVGAFDERYKLAWGDDGELHQRILLAGYKCLCVPSAVAFHEFKAFDPTRHYRAEGQLYNRWRYILTHYERRTLLLIAPALVVFECVQAGFYLLKGLPLVYLKGTWEAVRKLPMILEKRKEVQSLRAVADQELLSSGPLYVRPTGGRMEGIVLAAVQGVSWLLSAYWRLIQPLLADRSTSTTSSPSSAQGSDIEAMECSETETTSER